MEYFAPGHRACAGCGLAICTRMVLNTIGEDVIVANSTGCLEIISTPYPESAFEVPYIHSLFENVASVATGVKAALKAKGNDHTQVLCLAGDGATYDIGFGALSGMLERNDDVLYVCIDNEAYMNTGVQRSGATPRFAFTTTSQSGKVIHGKTEWKKPLVEIAASHQIPYSASASIAYPKDLEKKIKKAIGIRGARFIAVHTPCCTGWGFDGSLTIKVGKLAVKTGLWTLFEVEDGQFKLNYKPKKLTPAIEYLKTQRRFAHLTDAEVQEIQSRVTKKWQEYGVKS